MPNPLNLLNHTTSCVSVTSCGISRDGTTPWGGRLPRHLKLKEGFASCRTSFGVGGSQSFTISFRDGMHVKNPSSTRTRQPWNWAKHPFPPKKIQGLIKGSAGKTTFVWDGLFSGAMSVWGVGKVLWYQCFLMCESSSPESFKTLWDVQWKKHWYCFTVSMIGHPYHAEPIQPNLRRFSGDMPILQQQGGWRIT